MLHQHVFGSFVSIEPRVKLAGNDIHASVIDGYVAHGDPNGQQERVAVCESRGSMTQYDASELRSIARVLSQKDGNGSDWNLEGNCRDSGAADSIQFNLIQFNSTIPASYVSEKV